MRTKFLRRYYNNSLTKHFDVKKIIILIQFFFEIICIKISKITSKNVTFVNERKRNITFRTTNSLNFQYSKNFDTKFL